MSIYATDKDNPSTPNAKLSYSISNQIPDTYKVPLFQIDNKTGQVSTTPAGAQKLDPNIDAEYTLFLTVKDLEGLSDNAFSRNTQAKITVKENLWKPPNTLIITENSTDPHPIQITQVQWNEPGAVYVLQQKERYPNFPFSIDEDGKIYVTEPLDREERETYVLVVFAKDQDNTNLEEPIEVHVSVTDINDNPPVCNVPLTVLEVQENEKIGNHIGSLEAFDLDESGSLNSMLKYQILDQEPKLPSSKMFIIEEYSGNIQIEHDKFQKTKVPAYNLTVKVTDMAGAPTGFDTVCSVVIRIIESNDRIPIFEKQQYELSSIPEDIPVGTTLLTIGAIDEDEPKTGSSKILYHIVEGDAEGTFAISTDEETNQGYVMIKKPLDFETMPVYKLRIDARNPEPLVPGVDYNTNSTAYLNISVIDVNESPVFGSPEYQATVKENISVGNTILKVDARDPEGSSIRYKLEGDVFNWLKINSETGDIITNSALDREITDTYKVRVIAVQFGSPALESTVFVSIYLVDVNDNPPMLIYPETHFCFPVHESKAVLMKAVDKDLDPHGPPFQFSLKGDDKIDMRDWEIVPVNDSFAKLKMRHTDFKKIQYDVKVNIRDKGNLEKTHTVSVLFCKCSQNEHCYIEVPPQSGRPTVGATVGVLLGTLLVFGVALFYVFYLSKKNTESKATTRTFTTDAPDAKPMLQRAPLQM
ncbi:cadherin-17 isoform X2 [Polyodon spathula]|nr:cadherin-17 isoform X2 [Polyodon spathula]